MFSLELLRIVRYFDVVEHLIRPTSSSSAARRQNQMLLFGITTLCRITYFKRFKTYCYGIRMEGRIMSDPLPKRRLGTSFDGEIRGSKSPKGSYRRKLQPNSRQVIYTSRGKISIDGWFLQRSAPGNFHTAFESNVSYISYSLTLGMISPLRFVLDARQPSPSFCTFVNELSHSRRKRSPSWKYHHRMVSWHNLQQFSWQCKSTHWVQR